MREDRRGGPPLELVWSLWSELGIPGPRRDHRRAILDPERLLAVTPWFARSDARLSDLVFAWCMQHGPRLSGSRLTALLRAAHPDVRVAAEAFLGELATVGVSLVRVHPVTAARPRAHRDLPIDAERPALLRLRMRALVGAGGRGEVLVALLSTPDAWVSASSLVDEVGMAKRHVARILAELEEGAIADTRQRGNVREFRLRNPSGLAELVTLSPNAVFPRWGAVFEWMRLIDELGALPANRPATVRVELNRRKDVLLALAIELGLPRLSPEAATDAAAILEWARDHAQSLADGTARAVGGEATKDVPALRTG